MAWTIYRSSDASAPALDGQAGSLITVLDGVLVTGYGTQPAAGWTKDYTGTNKATFRNGAGATSRKYYRVQDDGPGAGTTKEARIRGFDTMSDVDTGTNEFPTAAQQANAGGSLVVRKSAAATSTTRTWMIAADDKTAILFIQSGDTAGRWFVTYFGETFSYKSADAQCAALIGRTTENVTTLYEVICWHIASTTAGLSTVAAGHFMAGSVSGVGSVTCGKWSHPGAIVLASGSDVAGQLAYPNPADSGLILTPLFLYTTGTITLRGKLRGLFLPLHGSSNWTDGDTFSGTGSYAGRTFLIVEGCTTYGTLGSTESTGTLVLETSSSIAATS
jgi:hypothetical protein